MYDVLKYVNENLCEEFNLNAISKKFGYSKWYFCELFKQYTGYTFLEYIRHRRMQLAATDIINGEKIIDVALKYGYETSSGFNKAFLTEFGCIPTEIKQDEKRYRNLYEERKMKMFKLSDRCASLRHLIMNEKPYNDFLFTQRDFYFVKGAAECSYKYNDNNSLIAAGLASVIKNFPPAIYDGELLVGNNFADPEEHPGDKDVMAKCLEKSGFSKEEIESYFSNKSIFSEAFSIKEIYPYNEQQKALERELASTGWCCADNHTVIGYQKVVELGFEGILAEINTLVTNENKAFYEPLIWICEAACTLGEKFADKLEEELAKEGHTDTRKNELKEMISVCRNVPRKPAKTFWEAVQSLLFAHIINTWEDRINANSLGRLDQILFPYYKADMEKGILTKSEAFEIICCLWLKLYRDYDVQQSCVGGCDIEGNTAINDLSYLMLDATEQLDFIRCLSVRFNKDTEKEFIKRALEVVGHVQKGVPFFFNDDVMIPSLLSHGIKLEDARDYTQLGCIETVIPGKSNPHAVTARCNLLKAIEYALNNGCSGIFEGVRPGLETGDVSSFVKYEQLKEAVFTQMQYLIEEACKMTLCWLDSAKNNNPKPYKSMLTQGCFEQGIDFNNRGAIYDYYQVMLLGIPNLADSLQAIYTLIYKDKRYTIDELVYQLKNNYPDEVFRLDFVNRAAKFGNDIDEVDEKAAEIMNFACDELELLSKKYGYDFHAQPFTFLWMVDHGNLTAATPDGRFKGEIIAYSVSPMQGRDFNGFTALINSLAKLPTKKAPGTTSAILEVDPLLFTDQNINYFADILLAGAEKGLCNVQFNVVDADLLIEAQKHPEKHKNLAVRVSGFSQKFYLLDKKLQDHIIARTKHKYI